MTRLFGFSLTILLFLSEHAAISAAGDGEFQTQAIQACRKGFEATSKSLRKVRASGTLLEVYGKLYGDPDIFAYKIKYGTRGEKLLIDVMPKGVKGKKDSEVIYINDGNYKFIFKKYALDEKFVLKYRGLDEAELVDGIHKYKEGYFDAAISCHNLSLLKIIDDPNFRLVDVKQLGPYEADLMRFSFEWSNQSGSNTIKGWWISNPKINWSVQEYFLQRGDNIQDTTLGSVTYKEVANEKVYPSRIEANYSSSELTWGFTFETTDFDYSPPSLAEFSPRKYGFEPVIAKRVDKKFLIPLAFFAASLFSLVGMVFLRRQNNLKSSAAH